MARRLELSEQQGKQLTDPWKGRCEGAARYLIGNLNVPPLAGAGLAAEYPRAPVPIHVKPIETSREPLARDAAGGDKRFRQSAWDALTSAGRAREADREDM